MVLSLKKKKKTNDKSTPFSLKKLNFYLFQNNSMSVELLGCVADVLDFGGNSKAHPTELSDLPHQGHQTVSVIDL